MDTITAKAFWEMVQEEERLKRERDLINLQIRALRARMAANQRARKERRKASGSKSSLRRRESPLHK